MKKDTILSGMRPTGRLHLGHLSVLENWRRFQERYNCYYMVANWHALTTALMTWLAETTKIVLDWLMVGLKSRTLLSSQRLKSMLNSTLLLSLILLSWLERCPTYKDQVQQFKDRAKISLHTVLKLSSADG